MNFRYKIYNTEGLYPEIIVGESEHIEKNIMYVFREGGYLTIVNLNNVMFIKREPV